MLKISKLNIIIRLWAEWKRKKTFEQIERAIIADLLKWIHNNTWWSFVHETKEIICDNPRLISIAYSVQQTVLPTQNAKIRLFCVRAK